MSTGFPTSLDTYTVKNNGDTLQPAHVNDIQDAVSALEAKVGADGSTVATSHTKKIADLTTLTNILSSVTASAAELNIMDGVTATTAELNKLDADNLTTGDLLTKGASAIEVISAVAATQYLKSAGTSTKPAYGSLALRDTGVKVVSFTHTAGTTGNQTIAGVGFQPSAAIIAWLTAGGIIGVGFDTVTNRGAVVFGVESGTMYSRLTTDKIYEAPAGGNTFTAKFTSFNSDGGVIGWTAHDAVMGDVNTIAIFIP